MKSHLKNLLIMLFALWAVFLSQATAQENNNDTATDAAKKNDTSLEVNSIVITATRTKEKLKDVPVHVEVITGDDIEKAGIPALGDIIAQKVTGHYQRYIGGAQAAGLSGNLTSDDFGDTTSDRVIVLIDGHRSGTGDLSKIPTEIIDRVEIIKGPASALYGSAALGGVINIITKKGKHDDGNTAKLEAGSFNYMRTALSGGDDLNDYASYFFTASYSQVDDYHTKHYGTVYNSNETKANFWGNLNLTPAPDQSLRLGFSYTDIDSHYPQWNNYEAYTYYDNSVEYYNNLARGHADLEYNLSLFDDRLRWKAVAYQLWDQRSLNWGAGAKPEDDSTICTDNTTGTDQQFEINILPYNKIVTGCSFEFLKRDILSKQAGVTVENPSPDFNYYTNSIYIQDTVKLLNDKFLVIFGARYDKFDLETEDSAMIAKDISFDNISPRGGIVCKPFDFFRIRGNICKAFRAPNADELTYYSNLYAPYIYAGNPDLEPETSITYDSGFDIYLDYLNFGATYSFIKLKDFIEYQYSHTDSDGNSWFVTENIDNSQMKIIDCYIAFQAGRLLKLPLDINLSSNITYNMEYKNTDTGEKLPYIADREIKSSIQTIYKSLNVNLSHVYVGHEIAYLKEKKGSFYFFNLTATYALSQNISAEAGIFNLTNEDYEWVKEYPMPERNYKIGVTGKF